jgi:hypothetical protein
MKPGWEFKTALEMGVATQVTCALLWWGSRPKDPAYVLAAALVLYWIPVGSHLALRRTPGKLMVVVTAFGFVVLYFGGLALLHTLGNRPSAM